MANEIRLLTVGCLLAATAEIVISSAVLDWGGRSSLGARRLIPLTPIVTIFAAVALEGAIALFHATGLKLRALATGTLALTLVNNIPAATILRGDIDMSQAELYGAWSPLRPLWALADRTVGDVALLPAQWYFRNRYGLPNSAYRDAMVPRFLRNERDLTVTADEIRTSAPWVAKTSSGFSFSADGAHLGQGPARLVFASEWPVATHASILVRTNQPTKLRLSVGSVQGLTRFAEILVKPNEERYEIELPKGTLESGINEWAFEAIPPADVVLVAFRLRDERRLEPVVKSADTAKH